MKKKSKKKKNKKLMMSLIVILLIAIALILVLNNNINKFKPTSVSEETPEMLNKEEPEEIVPASADEPEVQAPETTNEENIEPKKEEKTPTQTNSSPYYIKVNYQANTVTIYKNENGEKKPIKAMVCSCGTSTPTSGVYKTPIKYTWRPLIGGVYGQYATRIVGSILFHSVPYTKQSKDSLEYWEYDKLGETASAGCVRLTVADAKWIYDNCPIGTEVEFYASAEPGPLGKPTAQKISNNEECRNWDPTDNVKENPWMSWSSKKEEQENKKENTVETNTVSNTVNKITENKTVENNAVKNETNKIEKNIINKI